jgi:hypothetical protein
MTPPLPQSGARITENPARHYYCVHFCDLIRPTRCSCTPLLCLRRAIYHTVECEHEHTVTCPTADRGLTCTVVPSRSVARCCKADLCSDLRSCEQVDQIYHTRVSSKQSVSVVLVRDRWQRSLLASEQLAPGTYLTTQRCDACSTANSSCIQDWIQRLPQSSSRVLCRLQWVSAPCSTLWWS